MHKNTDQNIQTAPRWARAVFAKGVRLLLSAALLAVLTNVGVLPVPVAQAATINVNTTNDIVGDDGVCSLREAITAANTNTASGATSGECPAGSAAPTTDIINLPAGTYTLTGAAGDDANNSGDLDIAAGGDLTINGAGAGSTIIDGNGGVTNDRVLDIFVGITVNISGVTIQNGDVANIGGGIFIVISTLNIANSTISGNQATSGGGIFIDASTVNITNSTLSGNTATGGLGSGGGIYNGAGILNIANSTLSGNQADDDGGGVYNTGTITLDNVTITGNTADNDTNGSGNGGGVHCAITTVNLRNTIIAGNTDGSPVTKHPDCSGDLVSHGYNLIGDDTGIGGGGTPPQNGVNGDQVGTSGSPIDPLLGPLADNGGSTQTHALQAGSPAIDAGSCTDIGSNPVLIDQRGVARPQGATCDVGAYEAQPTLSIGKTATPTTDVAYHGTVTYTVVLSNSGAGHGSGTVLTDTLPVEVDFASWVIQPANANQANDQITWGGTVTASTAITFAFVVTHTGDYGDVVTNTAEYRYTPIISGSAEATFTVLPASYLPVIQKNNVITP